MITFGKRLRGFARHRQGNVLILFALLLIPMLGAIGLALDFGQILTARSKAQVGADAAALQASGVARDLIKAGDGSLGASNAAIAEAKTRAKGLFDAYALQSGLEGYTIAIDVLRQNQNISATAQFSVTRRNNIGKLFGQESFTAKGSATSSSSLPSYVDVYVAMDISQSMGIGATNTDMIALYKKVSCVFGCHSPTSSQSVSNQSVAKANGIQLRVDVLKEAVKNMISTAKTDSQSDATYRIGMYTMGATPGNLTTWKLTELSPASGDFTALTSKADGIDLGPNDTRGVGDSYFNEPLGALGTKVPTPGDGSSQAKAKSYVYIITDGAKDTPTGAPCPSGHCMATIDPAICKKFKDRDVIVGVLYTTYLPVYQNPLNATDTTLQTDYKNLLVSTGVAAQIPDKLKQCASPGWFYEASDSAGIKTALKQMFEQTTIAPALTQ